MVREKRSPVPDEGHDSSETPPVPDATPVVEPSDAPVTAPPEVIPETAPAPELPQVDLEVFASACGIKLDQLAGFKRWAKIQKLGLRTMPEWLDALKTYNTRPV